MQKVDCCGGGASIGRGREMERVLGCEEGFVLFKLLMSRIKWGSDYKKIMMGFQAPHLKNQGNCFSKAEHLNDCT
jgi:hypothetical protein